jgi:hypothetical protein
VPFSEDLLRSVLTEYEEAKRQLLARRDEQLRTFHANGWRPVDLQRITGYSRETIRHALNPDVRIAANAGRRKNTRVAAHLPTPAAVVEPTPAPAPTAYSDRKPYVVADRLEELTGPTTGTVTLPHHLDWSGQADYDLDRPKRLASMYKAVLNEAAKVQDLRDWIDQRKLVELWPRIWLPVRLRDLWESRFPELGARRAAMALAV